MRGSLLNTNFRLRLLALALVLAAPTSAHAFYWAGWPGSGVNEPPSITPRQIPETPTPPTVKPTDTPKGVPEPATIIIAGLGLGMLGLRKVLKRKK